VAKTLVLKFVNNEEVACALTSGEHLLKFWELSQGTLHATAFFCRVS
jgi:hypothetical protein